MVKVFDIEVKGTDLGTGVASLAKYKSGIYDIKNNDNSRLLIVGMYQGGNNNEFTRYYTVNYGKVLEFLCFIFDRN